MLLKNAVVHDGLGGEERLDVLIARLTADRSREILRYRRLVW